MPKPELDIILLHNQYTEEKRKNEKGMMGVKMKRLP
jgi:hypothetical protein